MATTTTIHPVGSIVDVQWGRAGSKKFYPAVIEDRWATEAHTLRYRVRFSNGSWCDAPKTSLRNGPSRASEAEARALASPAAAPQEKKGTKRGRGDQDGFDNRICEECDAEDAPLIHAAQP